MKRTFDFVTASLGFAMTSPLLLAAAIAVKLDSPGPAFYSGPRVGRNGKQFQIHKLRTMRTDADLDGPAVTAADDSRVTGVGRWLRRTKADELPQLLNVIKGEMSLVGPRPEHPDFVKHYSPQHRRLLHVRPGMTGPTALAFLDEEEILRGGDSTATYVREVLGDKLDADLSYVESATFAGDLKILARTGFALLVRPFRR